MSHQSISEHIITCSVQLSTIAAVLFIIAGVDYVRIGVGCHPVIAGIAAVVLLFLPHMLQDMNPRQPDPEDVIVNVRERKS